MKVKLSLYFLIFSFFSCNKNSYLLKDDNALSLPLNVIKENLKKKSPEISSFKDIHLKDGLYDRVKEDYQLGQKGNQLIYGKNLALKIDSIRISYNEEDLLNEVEVFFSDNLFKDISFLVFKKKKSSILFENSKLKDSFKLNMECFDKVVIEVLKCKNKLFKIHYTQAPNALAYIIHRSGSGKLKNVNFSKTVLPQKDFTSFFKTNHQSYPLKKIDIESWHVVYGKSAFHLNLSTKEVVNENNVREKDELLISGLVKDAERYLLSVESLQDKKISFKNKSVNDFIHQTSLEKWDKDILQLSFYHSKKDQTTIDIQMKFEPIRAPGLFF